MNSASIINFKSVLRQAVEVIRSKVTVKADSEDKLPAAKAHKGGVAECVGSFYVSDGHKWTKLATPKLEE